MDWDDFHRRAKRVVPQQELKARRCWIGVLDHRKSTQDDFKETDFLWMIGHNVSSIAFSVRDNDVLAASMRAEYTWNAPLQYHAHPLTCF